MLAILLHELGSVVVEDCQEKDGLEQAKGDGESEQKSPQVVAVEVLHQILRVVSENHIKLIKVLLLVHCVNIDDFWDWDS